MLLYGLDVCVARRLVSVLAPKAGSVADETPMPCTAAQWVVTRVIAMLGMAP